MRKSGILLSVSSLPSQYGIGCFSKEAYAFVDFLEESGMSLWQILPLGPTGHGDSPYQSFSTFAGNPYYIDLTELILRGWITGNECREYDYGNPEYVEYDIIVKSRERLLREAYYNSGFGEKNGETEFADLYPEYTAFKKNNEFWLKDYALYMAIKRKNQRLPWTDWDVKYKLRDPKAMEEFVKNEQTEILYYYFEQFFFLRQWTALKSYANSKGIEIVGDIPIYVAGDGADTWSHPELFQLDDKCDPIAVAGCPPDYFSETGQLWGNPLYDWDYHKKTGYEWWILRMKHSFTLYDVLRIDHFRGFDEFYSIPAGSENAVNGKWVQGPGYDLFKAIKKALGNKKIIAEDLGFMTPSVLKLVKQTGYPGMKVLQFAFDHTGGSPYLPYNHTDNCVVYTGTHDNDTTVGWYESLRRRDRSFAKKYLNVKSKSKVPDAMMKIALASVADMAIIPMQDVLKLGSEARMNIPSTVGNNWKWRMKADACNVELAEYLRDLNHVYGRLVR